MKDFVVLKAKRHSKPQSHAKGNALQLLQFAVRAVRIAVCGFRLSFAADTISSMLHT